MERTWLVQRLTEPWKASGALAGLGADNPFAFGGGHKNGVEIEA